MIAVLRLGHRIFRDQRISSHVALVARAFGAQKIYYSGQRDRKLEQSIKKVVEQWGGPFEIEYTENWRKIIKEFKGAKVHLTVYGLPIQNVINKIRNLKNILIIVGGEKVSSEVLKLVDYNVSITQQPHSEVASLCYFLDYYFKRKELKKKFKNAKLRIIPQEKGKKVIEKM